MRILFTTTAGLGHYHPLVPITRAAKARGHELAFAATRSLQKSIEASGFRALITEDNLGADPEREALIRQTERLPSGAIRSVVGA